MKLTIICLAANYFQKLQEELRAWRFLRSDWPASITFDQQYK